MSSAQAVSARYDHPEYLIVRSQMFDRHGITSSSLKFAQFHARVKMYVSNIIIGIRSAASLAALNAAAYLADSYQGTASAIAGATATWISATSVGSIQTIALNLTLTENQYLSLGFNDAKGKVFVEYQYQILPA